MVLKLKCPNSNCSNWYNVWICNEKKMNFYNIWLLVLLNDILRNFLLGFAFIVVGSMSISPCNQSLVPSLFFYFKSIQPFLNSFTVILLAIGSVVLISVPKCNFTSHSNKLLRRDLVHWFFGQSHLKGFFQNFYRRTDLHTWYHVNYIIYII